MSRRQTLLVVFTATLLFNSSLVFGQAMDQFVQGLVDFVTAVDGTRADEGPALLSAIQTMADGLQQWDAAVARVEAGLASEIGGAPRAAAARMRGTLGSVYLERGRFDAALAQFDMASALDPSFADVQGLRALTLERLNRPRDAIAAYRAAWQLDRTNPAYAYRVIQSQPASAASTESEDALSVLITAANAPRASASAQRFFSADLFDDASVPDPVFPLARYVDAFALLRQGKYDGAIARLRSSASADPLITDAAKKDSAEAHRILGLAHAQATRYEQAIAELRTAIRLAPDNERAHLALGDVLVLNHDPAAARMALAETTKVIPRSGQAYWKLGNLHRTFGDEANAVRSFEAAAALYPFAGVGHLQAAIGRLYHNQLDLDAAVAAYWKRIAATPSDATAHLDLADVYRASDDQPRALAEALLGALLDPSSARSYATIGQIHAAMGRDADAVAALRRAVALDASHLEAHYALSRALARLNRPDEARDELQIFERLQAKSMAEERQRFQDNQRKIQDTLSAAEPRDRSR